MDINTAVVLRYTPQVVKAPLSWHRTLLRFCYCVLRFGFATVLRQSPQHSTFLLVSCWLSSLLDRQQGTNIGTERCFQAAVKPRHKL